MRVDPADTTQAWLFPQEKYQAPLEGEHGGPGILWEGASALVNELSQRGDVCLFALDETGIRIESSSLYGWAPKGLPSMQRQTATTRESTS